MYFRHKIKIEINYCEIITFLLDNGCGMQCSSYSVIHQIDIMNISIYNYKKSFVNSDLLKEVKYYPTIPCACDFVPKINSSQCMPKLQDFKGAGRLTTFIFQTGGLNVILYAS